MNIAIDFDNTIYDTTRTLHNIYNYENNLTEIENPYPSDESNIFWDFVNLVPKEYEKKCFELLDSYLFIDNRFSCFEPNALNIINKLSSYNNKIVIVTKQPNQRKERIVRIRDTYLPFCDLVFTNSFDKSAVLKGIDMIIDDRPDCLDSAKDVPYKVLFKKYGWNKDCHKYKRINDWIYIEQYVKYLKDWRQKDEKN